MHLLRVSALVLATLIALALQGCAAGEDFQTDADIFRLRHLQYYGELIQEFQRATGHLPLQDREDAPVYVFVAHSDQLAGPPAGPTYEHVVVPFADFVAELEDGLGRTIEERYDPQLRPAGRPNFYLYLVTGDTYFLAVHLHQAMPFANRIDEHYFKAEISNHPNDANGAHDPATLFGSEAFRAEAGKTPARAGFFEERAAKYVHATKN